jgi:3-isopropylmalate/(R)-2-methylmalate dehydratase large subunit
MAAAGAKLLPNACGMCAGYNSGLDETSPASPRSRETSRAAWGHRARIYLGSPYTVAASAVRGRITDPREMLS